MSRPSSSHGIHRAAALQRPGERKLLRAALARSRRDLRRPACRELRARSALHARRVRRLSAPAGLRRRLLDRAHPRTDRDRDRRHGPGTFAHPAALRARPALQLPAHVRAHPHDPGRRSPTVRAAGAAVSGASRTRKFGVGGPRGVSHVPPLRDRLLDRRLHSGVVRHRADAARDDRARRDRASRAHAGAWDQRRPLGHSGVRLRRRPRRARRGPRRAHAQRLSAHGERAHHLRVRCRGHRRDGLDRRGCRRWVPGRRSGESRRRLQPSARERSRVRADGDRAARAAGGPLRFARGSLVNRVLSVLPYAVAMSVDLLLGYVGLLSFGHAAFWGLGAYAAAIAAKSTGVPFALAALVGAAAAGLLAVPFGYLAIRRRGIYFAMVTLAFAQLVFYLANEWRDVTGGENGLHGVPRTFPGLALGRSADFYYAALPMILLGYALAYRIVHSPFGHVLVAIRDNEPRAQALGYATWRYKLLAL